MVAADGTHTSSPTLRVRRRAETARGEREGERGGERERETSERERERKRERERERESKREQRKGERGVHCSANEGNRRDR
jgi:hypothetical protein